jgi:hypothetical protein
MYLNLGEHKTSTDSCKGTPIPNKLLIWGTDF